MFKLTGISGLRRASAGGGAPQAAGRIISPMNKFRSNFVRFPWTGAPFTPASPEERTFDNSDSNPRLQGLEKRIKRAAG